MPNASLFSLQVNQRTKQLEMVSFADSNDMAW